jgi:hypothetical protein
VEVAFGSAPWARDTTDLEEFLDMIEPPAWHADAACKEHPELNWVPGRGDDTTAPKAVCDGCLVAAECRAWALRQVPDLYGVWGGLTRRQRLRLHDGRTA